MGNREIPGSWEATLTLWSEAVPEGSSSEDSIRTSQVASPMGAAARPRFRTLEGATDSPADFELGEQLGSGGMGVIYAANQTAFNREVAVKMVRPDRNGSATAADALIAEAIVTGRLEHPNVVPVYDLGVDAQGQLFYAMKEVQGFPWSELMAEKTLDENLDILLRVADTVSFAHSRGILHRDLKPQNIMLGEFGEVMVMDWGASCDIGNDQERPGSGLESSLSGTPVYMPPEMARGDLNRQGVGTDIYLLGGMLYRIVAGHPPRREKDVVLCLSMAAENVIEPVEESSELLRIALKAMAARPSERFSNVRKFQQAIRDYRSHSESLMLMESARENLVRGRSEKDYDLFSRAIFGFRESLELWPDNPDAEGLRLAAVRDYARCAFDNADFELALSLLEPGNPQHAELLDLVRKAIRDRDAHKRRSRRLLLGVRMLGTVLLILFALAFFLIRSEQRKTIAEHRRGLINLISARFGEQNYEAAVAAFWRFYDQYGMGGLDEETLLDVRVAAAMNPYRGVIDSGVKDALKIMPAAEDHCVWVVGTREMKKVRIDPDVGYDSSTMVAIHDYRFGKRKKPGSVGQTIPLPVPLSCGEAVWEGSDQALWIGGGSFLYRRADDGWEPVLDVSQLDYPPLPTEYNIDRAAVEQWMAAKGRKLPITGILLNKAQTRVAIALGSQTVGWFDLQTRQCLGWLATGYGTLFGKLLKGGGGKGALFALSPDERQLAYRPSAQNQALVFWFSLPGMVRQEYAYNRDYPIRSMAYDGAGLFRAATQDGHLFSPNEDFLEYFHQCGFADDDRNRWDPGFGTYGDFPCNDIALGAFSADGMKCCVLTDDGTLLATAGRDEGFMVGRRIVKRETVDCYIADNGFVSLATAAGDIHLYDMQNYSVCAVPVDGVVSNLCRAWSPTNLLALVEDGKETVVCELGVDADGRVGAVPRMKVEAETIACDPQGRFLATCMGHGVRIYNLAGKNQVFHWKNSCEEPSSELGFDETGTYFRLGGGWKGGLQVLEAGSWNEVITRAVEMAEIPGGSYYTDVVFDDYLSQPTLLLTRGEPKTLEAYALPGNGRAPLLKWSKKTGSSPMAIIPFTDVVSGKRNYWCKLWFQDFQLYDAETGEASGVQRHWVRTGLRHPEFISNDPRVVFPMENGKLQIALKSDLLPVFDPRALDVKVDRAVLNSDATRLYLLSDGKLYCMKLPGAP